MRRIGRLRPFTTHSCCAESYLGVAVLGVELGVELGVAVLGVGVLVGEELGVGLGEGVPPTCCLHTVAASGLLPPKESGLK